MIRSVINIPSLINQVSAAIVVGIGIDPRAEREVAQLQAFRIGDGDVVKGLARETVSPVDIAVTVGGGHHIADNGAVVAVATVVVDISVEGIVCNKVFFWIESGSLEVRHQFPMARHRETV